MPNNNCYIPELRVCKVIEDIVQMLNLQNIPSHNKDIRMMFCAGTIPNTQPIENSSFTVTIHDEIETTTGWKTPDKLVAGTDIITDGEEYACISNVVHEDDKYIIYVVSQLTEKEVVS